MKRKILIAFVLIIISLCSVCFAKTPQFDYLFSDDIGWDYFYDVNNTWWKPDNKELITVVRIKSDTGVTWTEMHGIKDLGNYTCLYWGIIDSSEGRKFDDRTNFPQWEQVTDKTEYKLYNKIWNIMLPKRY